MALFYHLVVILEQEFETYNALQPDSPLLAPLAAVYRRAQRYARLK